MYLNIDSLKYENFVAYLKNIDVLIGWFAGYVKSHQQFFKVYLCLKINLRTSVKLGTILQYTCRQYLYGQILNLVFFSQEKILI